METNFEHYKDELLKLFLTSNSRCAFIKKHILHTTNCSTIPCTDCSAKVEKWLDEEYKKPSMEIDWSRVPADTPVYVSSRKDSGSKYRRFFSHFKEESEAPYYCFNDGKSSWTAGNVSSGWKHCELAREEDIEKYAKEEKQYGN